MADVPTTTETHVRKHTAMVDSKTISRLLAEHVAKSVEFGKPRIGSPGVTYKVCIEDETEGSPPYRVGVKARVVITEDLMPQEEDTTNA